MYALMILWLQGRVYFYLKKPAPLTPYTLGFMPRGGKGYHGEGCPGVLDEGLLHEHSVRRDGGLTRTGALRSVSRSHHRGLPWNAQRICVSTHPDREVMG